MNLIDSHIHLDFEAFDDDREILLANVRTKGVSRFVVPATTRKSWPRIDGLTQSNPAISVAYGIHPYFSQAHTLDDCEALNSWLETHHSIAIGEIGLDYFLKELDKSQQMKLFDAQLEIASSHRMPVILHARKAVDDVINQLKSHGIEQGIVHSFNGSHVQATRLIEMGFKLGFGGAITYPRATRLQTLIKKLPLDSICLETDAPDQPPVGYMGNRNEPLALIEVLEFIARLRNSEPEIIAHQTSENTYAALNIC